MSSVGNLVRRAKEEINEWDKRDLQKGFSTSPCHHPPASQEWAHPKANSPSQKLPVLSQNWDGEKGWSKVGDKTSTFGSILHWCKLLSWWDQKKSLLLYLFYLRGIFTRQFIYEMQNQAVLWVRCLCPAVPLWCSPRFLEDAEPPSWDGDIRHWGSKRFFVIWGI